jgi:hypothetical protein
MKNCSECNRELRNVPEEGLVFCSIECSMYFKAAEDLGLPHSKKPKPHHEGWYDDIE